MARPVPLGVGIALLTIVAWGGRLNLLGGGEHWFDIARIVGSVIVGAAATAVLIVPPLQRASTPVLALFALWTLTLWTRSLIVNWAGSGTLAFKLVHTGLAAGFFYLSWLAIRGARIGRPFAGRDAISGPDQAHRQQQG